MAAENVWLLCNWTVQKLGLEMGLHWRVGAIFPRERGGKGGAPPGILLCNLFINELKTAPRDPEGGRCQSSQSIKRSPSPTKWQVHFTKGKGEILLIGANNPHLQRRKGILGSPPFTPHQKQEIRASFLWNSLPQPGLEGGLRLPPLKRGWDTFLEEKCRRVWLVGDWETSTRLDPCSGQGTTGVGVPGPASPQGLGLRAALGALRGSPFTLPPPEPGLSFLGGKGAEPGLSCLWPGASGQGAWKQVSLLESQPHFSRGSGRCPFPVWGAGADLGLFWSGSGALRWVLRPSPAPLECRLGTRKGQDANGC